MNDSEKERRLTDLTKREREVLEAICLHKNLQLQEIARKGLIRKGNNKPIAVGTLKAYMQKLYDKLGIESRDRMGLEREYCPLIESGDAMRWEAEKSWLTKNRMFLFTVALVGSIFVILAFVVGQTLSDEPLPCENLEIAREVFPQLAGELPLEPFSNKESSRVFICEGVRDLVHNATVSVHLSYEDGGVSTQYGYFGISGFNGFDVSAYNEFCLQAYAKEPRQGFWVNLKDVSSPPGFDTRIPVVVPATFSWMEICVELQEYRDRNEGLDLSQLENVNLGFDNRTGTAEVWISGFEFR